MPYNKTTNKRKKKKKTGAEIATRIHSKIVSMKNYYYRVHRARTHVVQHKLNHCICVAKRRFFL